MMTKEVANRGHCTSGGTIISGAAVCECGWKASEYAPENRKEARKAHLDEVLRVRRGQQ